MTDNKNEDVLREGIGQIIQDLTGDACICTVNEILALSHRATQQAVEAAVKEERIVTASLAVIKKVALWGIESCMEHATGSGVFSRRECPRCWRALSRGTIPEETK